MGFGCARWASPTELHYFVQRADTFLPALICYLTLLSSPAHFLPTAKKFSEDHEWVVFDDATGVATIGITEYAQKALGDVVFVELPAVGTEFESGGECEPRPSLCSGGGSVGS